MINSVKLCISVKTLKLCLNGNSFHLTHLLINNLSNSFMNFLHFLHKGVKFQMEINLTINFPKNFIHQQNWLVLFLPIKSQNHFAYCFKKYKQNVQHLLSFEKNNKNSSKNLKNNDAHL